jgi:hypothetical protein
MSASGVGRRSHQRSLPTPRLLLNLGGPPAALFRTATVLQTLDAEYPSSL